MRLSRRIGSVAAALAIVASAFAGDALAAPYARLNTTGPELSIPRERLRDSLQCTGGLRHTNRDPVLLLSGTTVDPDENFAWNWQPALSDAGFAWCASAVPGANMDDVQIRGEYVVYAIRRMFRRADRRISVFGHSQGGMVGRWALRFWPDTRRMVRDMVGAAPSNHGTDVAGPICLPGCAPSFWQQRSDSDFIEALNSRAETFAGVSYTNVYTHLDQVVFPNLDDSGRSSLHTGKGVIANVAVQDVCPLDLSEHLLLGTIDPVAWELFLDAVRHRGPADPERIDAGVCSKGTMPGVDPATMATDLAAAAGSLATTIATYPPVPAEPPLRDYVFARR